MQGVAWGEGESAWPGWKLDACSGKLGAGWHWAERGEGGGKGGSKAGRWMLSLGSLDQVRGAGEGVEEGSRECAPGGKLDACPVLKTCPQFSTLCPCPSTPSTPAHPSTHVPAPQYLSSIQHLPPLFHCVPAPHNLHSLLNTCPLCPTPSPSPPGVTRYALQPRPRPFTPQHLLPLLNACPHCSTPAPAAPLRAHLPQALPDMRPNHFASPLPPSTCPRPSTWAHTLSPPSLHTCFCCPTPCLSPSRPCRTCAPTMRSVYG